MHVGWSKERKCSNYLKFRGHSKNKSQARKTRSRKIPWQKIADPIHKTPAKMSCLTAAMSLGSGQVYFSLSRPLRFRIICFHHVRTVMRTILTSFMPCCIIKHHTGLNEWNEIKRVTKSFRFAASRGLFPLVRRIPGKRNNQSVYFRILSARENLGTLNTVYYEITNSMFFGLNAAIYVIYSFNKLAQWTET